MDKVRRDKKDLKQQDIEAGIRVKAIEDVDILIYDDTCCTTLTISKGATGTVTASHSGEECYIVFKIAKFF